MVASISGGSQNKTSQKLQSSGFSFNVGLSNTAAANASALEVGKSIISSRNASSTAAAAQALANQTGGNIMGFTYE